MAEITYKLNIEGPEDFKTEYRVRIGITKLGRQPGNDIVLPHTQVSRGHAQLETTAEECHLTDLGSSNGTRLNGEKIEANAPVPLKGGDEVRIGPFSLTVNEEAAEALSTREMQRPQIDPSIVSSVEPAPEAPPEPEEKEAEPPKEEKEEEEEAVEAPEAEEKIPAAEKKPTRRRKPAAQKKEPAPKASSPPPAPPPPPPSRPEPYTNGYPPLPPGLSRRSSRLLSFLPGIYHTDFMARFLGIFEATELPIEWTIDNFDLFLDPATAPDGFLPWLAGWYGILFDATWSEEKRRMLLEEAHVLYARRGTRGALSRVLEIYTGEVPEIRDHGKDVEPFTFLVVIPLRKRDVRTDLVEALIDAHKPAHTNYKLEFKG